MRRFLRLLLMQAVGVLAAAALILLIAFTVPPAQAAERPEVAVEANTSFWWVISEEVENGLLQRGSLDPAAAHASGFNFKQGRLAFSFESPRGDIEAFLRLRLEERTDIIDFWGAYHIAPCLAVYMGQMKIPSIEEVLTPDHMLDFITRSSFGRNLGDYALSRTPYISSIMAVKSYDRDLGLAIKGAYPDGEDPLVGYFLMVGNGTGANSYIGGSESEEFLFTNSFGDFYYGFRTDLYLAAWLRTGTHFSLNRHENAALDARGPVFDLDRKVWTADFSADLPWGQRLDGFYGRGSISDFWDAQQYEFRYDGWAVWTIQPLLEGAIELALRYDIFTTEFNGDGNETSRKDWTAGVNYRPAENLRLQLNYIHKTTANRFEPDPDDDILYMNVQFLFDTPITQ